MADSPAEKANVPFQTLRNFEKRSLIHAVGLPEQAAAGYAWSGIAYRLGGANLVSEIGDIVEIMTFPDLTSVPGSKAWVLGVANVRGNLVPVVDLRCFLSGDKTTINKRSRVIVAQQHGGIVGLLIDEVAGQRHFMKDEEIHDGHYAEHMVGPFVQREFRKAEEVWGALDMPALVNSPDFLQAAA